MAGRRDFLDWLLGGWLAGVCGSVLYPISRYLVPPEVPEAAPQSVIAGKADVGLLPVDNAIAGTIREGYDLLAQYDLVPISEVEWKMDHRLLAPEGSELGLVREVLAHPLVLEECGRFLGTLIGARVIPVGIDPDRFAEAAQHVIASPNESISLGLEAMLGGRKLILGVDRLEHLERLQLSLRRETGLAVKGGSYGVEVEWIVLGFDGHDTPSRASPTQTPAARSAPSIPATARSRSTRGT